MSRTYVHLKQQKDVMFSPSLPCACVHMFVKCHHGFPPISVADRWAEWMWQQPPSRDVGWESLSSPATITFCVPYLTLHPSQKYLQLQRQLHFTHFISVLQHLFIQSWLYSAPSFCEMNECTEYKPLMHLKAWRLFLINSFKFWIP